jgi:formate hydrogenlyase subunit 3/multisubunit Na+/H+ antiporter MnhD subunit
MPLGKILIFAGLLLILVGLIITFGGRVPYIGKLPGDFRIQRDNFTFYFPLTTSIVVSLIISLLIWLCRR